MHFKLRYGKIINLKFFHLFRFEVSKIIKLKKMNEKSSSTEVACFLTRKQPINRMITVVDKNGYEKVHRIALTENNEDTVSTASFGNFMSGKRATLYFAF